MSTFLVVMVCVVGACGCVALAAISVQVRDLVRTVNALADERLYAPFLAALHTTYTTAYTDDQPGSWASAARHRRRDEDEGDEDADDEHQAADRDEPPEDRAEYGAAEDTGRHHLVGTHP